MEFILMATDGGPHPPAKWAAVTADGVLDIAATAPDTLLREATEFKRKVVDVLTRHHGLVQDHGRTGLATEGTDRLASPIDTSGLIPDAVDDIIALGRGTSFEAHFAKPETRAYLEDLLHNHFHHSMYIERSWHADAHSDHPLARAFRAAAADGHALLPLHDDDLEQHGGRDIVSRVLEANHLSAIRAPGA